MLIYLQKVAVFKFSCISLILNCKRDRGNLEDKADEFKFYLN